MATYTHIIFFLEARSMKQRKKLHSALRAHTPCAYDVCDTVHEHHTSQRAEWVGSVNRRHAEGKMMICRACETCSAI